MKRPLQVGERVAVYWGRRSIGLVEGFTSDGLIKLSTPEEPDPHGPVGWNGLWIAHPKQCRRLVPKKRRELWVNIHSGEIILHPPFDPDKWVHYVEARPKKARDSK